MAGCSLPRDRAEASPVAGTLQADTCLFQHLLLLPLVSCRPITRVKSQHGTIEEALPWLRQTEFLYEELRDLANRHQQKSGEHVNGL